VSLDQNSNSKTHFGGAKLGQKERRKATCGEPKERNIGWGKRRE